MSEHQIWRWDAAATAVAIRSGRISSREATVAALGRLHAVNPAINAVVESLEEEALAAASAADEALKRGASVGPLHGVPVTAKINVDLAGHATTNGLVPLKDAIASADSPSVASLRRAGAIIVGRTNVPAFSYRWFTGNALHGKTLNPWNPALSPGGSSGGAAAATAVGIGTLAHGNDVAGSLRLPPSACGVYGLRPTTGRLPSYNPSAQIERSLCLQMGATEGVIARSVRDLRLGLRALEQAHVGDPLQVMPCGSRSEAAMPCRVALFTGEAEFAAAPEIAALVRKAAGWLEDAGYVVEEAAPPRIAEMAELWMAMLYAETAGQAREAMYSLADDAFRQSYSDTSANLPALDAAGFHRAWQTRLAILREWSMFFQVYPVVLTPTSFQPTFPDDYDLRGKEAVGELIRAYGALSSTAGLALPAVSVPAGMVRGAPAGVQILAGRFQDDRCLAVAGVLEARIGPTPAIDPQWS
jgi:amidase